MIVFIENRQNLRILVYARAHDHTGYLYIYIYIYILVCIYDFGMYI